MKKNSGKTVTTVMKLAEPIAKELGYTIWDLQFIKEGAMWILRVIIDKDGGISLDDCEAMSRPLDKKLDEVDPIEQSYCLEVSSAGIEREFTREWHFDWGKGKKVYVKLTRPFEENGEREFVGDLIGYENEKIIIFSDEKEYSFDEKDVAIVRLYAEF